MTTEFKEEEINQVSGVVFNIQRYSIHDGPGIRTTVFLKGCPLRCFWCQNPESQLTQPEIMFDRSACTLCGTCVAKCPSNANAIVDGHLEFDHKKCNGCGVCSDVCPTSARALKGQRMTVGDVMAVVMKDIKHYARSGGGLTISGGDIVAQPRFTKALLMAAKKEGLHTAIETSGFTKWEILHGILQYTDYLFMDIKAIDPELHIKGTKVQNDVILENAKRAAKMPLTMMVRCPMIPGFNDAPEQVAAIAEFVVKEMGLQADQFSILKYNKYAEGKYERLGRENEVQHYEPQSAEYMDELNALIRSYGNND